METIVEIPERIEALPRNEKGYPVPFFVQWIDGKPDFRVVDSEKFIKAYRDKLCFICGQRLGVNLAFTIGPMCTVNRISAEPPAHLSCAEYAVQVCPWMSNPQMHRRERGLPKHEPAAGIMIKRNPGVMAIWVTKSHRLFAVMPTKAVRPGVLFDLGEPIVVYWYTEGRAASRKEVIAAFDAGLPVLSAEAETEKEVRQLKMYIERATRYWPT